MTGASDIKIGLRAAIAIAALAAALVLPAQAAAASECTNVETDPTAAQYCSPTEGEEASEVESEEASSEEAPAPEPSASGTEAASASGGSLPFTGLDLVALVAVAGALTAAGFALRRLSRPDEDVL